MRLSLKTKQVAGVTVIAGLTSILLGGWYLSSLARILLEESRSRAELLATAIYHRSRDVVATSAPDADLVANLQNDGGLTSLLQTSAYYPSVLYAAIVNPRGFIITHSDLSMVNEPLQPADDFDELIKAGPIAQARAIYTRGGRAYEFRIPLLLGTTEFGSIRVGVSTLFIQKEFEKTFTTPLTTVAAVLVGATLVAMLLAQLVLRPIHVIRSGLAKLGRGELDVDVDLPKDSEFGDLGDSFKAVTARLAADRMQLAGQRATLESVVEHLEDAVALFGPDGTLLFANPAMRASFDGAGTTLSAVLSDAHPYRALVDATMKDRAGRGPQTVLAPAGGERLVLTDVVTDADHGLVGVMLVARNLSYLSQVESTISYSRKLAALGRLSAGIAHEVKNPLNATMIHLELLKMQLADQPTAKEHLAIIAAQMRRLDEVVQGFLRFTRPEDLKLQKVRVGAIIDDLLPVIRAEASSHNIELRLECPPDLPPISADPGLLEQAFLNLAINACQAMPQGGRLRIAATARPGRRLEVVFEDTGIGIPPEHLARIFDLYFTTKQHGSGIGLSLVYRAVQLHDGEIEVQSVPGRGTTFRLLLRQDVTTSTPAAAVSAS
jgi:signal transduction histidine kinase